MVDQWLCVVWVGGWVNIEAMGVVLVVQKGVVGIGERPGVWGTGGVVLWGGN